MDGENIKTERPKSKAKNEKPNGKKPKSLKPHVRKASSFTLKSKHYYLFRPLPRRRLLLFKSLIVKGIACRKYFSAMANNLYKTKAYLMRQTYYSNI